MRERKRSLSIILILNNMQLYNDTRKKIKSFHGNKTATQISDTCSEIRRERERERTQNLTLIFKLCLEDPGSILSVST